MTLHPTIMMTITMNHTRHTTMNETMDEYLMDDFQTMVTKEIIVKPKEEEKALDEIIDIIIEEKLIEEKITEERVIKTINTEETMPI